MITYQHTSGSTCRVSYHVELKTGSHVVAIRYASPEGASYHYHPDCWFFESKAKARAYFQTIEELLADRGYSRRVAIVA